MYIYVKMLLHFILNKKNINIKFSIIFNFNIQLFVL